MARAVKKKETIEDRHLGFAPEKGEVLDRIGLAHAFRFYAYDNKIKDGRQWIVAFMKKAKFSASDISKFRALADTDIEMTHCTVAKLINDEVIIPSDVVARFNDRLVSYIALGEKRRDNGLPQTNKVTKLPATIVAAKISDMIATIDSIIDNFTKTYKGKFEFYEFLKKENIKGIHASKLSIYYTPLLDELNAAINKTDKQIVEGYDHLKPAELTRFRDFVKALVDDVNRFNQNAKRTAAPRKKSTVKKADVQVKNMKFQKTDRDLKVDSVDPVTIVGSQILVVYNTKYRQVSLYKTDGIGLTVKGSSLHNYDETSSFKKTVRRNKVDELMKTLLSGSKTEILRTLGSITSKTQSVNGRINQDTLLVRAIK